MPELPEVETIRRDLQEKIAGLVLSELKIRTRTILRGNQEALERECRGKKIIRLTRRGKYLGFKLEGAHTLWFHLGMTGQILVNDKPQEQENDPHVHATILFQDVRFCMVFRDIRKFGKLFMTNGCAEKIPGGLARLGPEPFEIEEAEFVNRFKSRQGKIKGLLLNQTLLAGLGNIYTDECLYRSGIRPTRRANHISKAHYAGLRKAICETLQEAIANGGSSIDDYLHVNGERGGFQNFHRVYGREGKPCLACKQLIQRLKVAGRSSYYCPKCQR